MKGHNLDHPTSQAFLPDPLELPTSKPESGRAEIQSLVYQTKPLSQLPREQAVAFCKQLYSPDERFAQGFFRYHKEILNRTDEEAWQATQEELKKSIQRLIDNLDDPRVRTIGFRQHEEYSPIGLYAVRPLEDHYNGKKLIQSMAETGLLEHYPGKLAIAHSFSALNGYRNRALMKYAFLLIALQALREEFQHIFFFMSDYRLGPIYKRFGLEFPPDLTFPDSKHLVGCYSITPEHLTQIQATVEQLGHLVPLDWQLP